MSTQMRTDYGCNSCGAATRQLAVVSSDPDRWEYLCGDCQYMLDQADVKHKAKLLARIILGERYLFV